MRRNTIKVYDGPSQLDGARIIMLVSGLTAASSNRKTGDMLQTWILRHDTAPNAAVKTGADASVCGNCPLRPTRYKSEGHRRPCYVKAWQAPLSVWKAHRDADTVPLDVVPALVGNLQVRRGSYGDPAAVPDEVWEALSNGARSTGYTHQWRTATGLARRVMASVHTAAEATQAQALGFRTFRVMGATDTLTRGEVLCPASKEAGVRASCATCGLCNGSTGPNDKRRSVAIWIH
jgi:hypothetical protein